jgi:hypothetical protein
LEERVKEVELENAELREQLNMPPANRVSSFHVLGLPGGGADLDDGLARRKGTSEDDSPAG